MQDGASREGVSLLRTHVMLADLLGECVQAQQKQQLKKNTRKPDLRGKEGRQPKSKRRRSSPDPSGDSKRLVLDVSETITSSQGATESATLAAEDAAVFQDMFN